MYRQKAWVSFFQSCSPGHRHKVTEKLLMGCTVRQVLCSVFKCLLAHIKISQAKWDGIYWMLGESGNPLGLLSVRYPGLKSHLHLCSCPGVVAYMITRFANLLIGDALSCPRFLLSLQFWLHWCLWEVSQLTFAIAEWTSWAEMVAKWEQWENY